MRAHILLNEKQVDHLEPVQLESAVSEAQASLADSWKGKIMSLVYHQSTKEIMFALVNHSIVFVPTQEMGSKRVEVT